MLFCVAAFYCFVPLKDIVSFKQHLLISFEPLNLCGTLLLAPEGINGTLAGSKKDIDTMLGLLSDLTGLPREDVKFSYAPEKPFNRLKIRLKREIITFKQSAVNPSQQVGTYVDAKDWNSLIEDPGILLIDTRNHYETRIGTFVGAHDPQIETFTEFADYVRRHLNPTQHKKIAMFCTGGIRCEKASAFMLSEGFENVYHLKGGILKYLEDTAPENTKWQGECYAFDRRVAVGHGLTTGRYAMCFICGAPLTENDQKHALFEEGVSCHHCHTSTTPDDKKRFRMRQHQIVAENHERHRSAVD